jgi:hypothetical protein
MISSKPDAGLADVMECENQFTDLNGDRRCGRRLGFSALPIVPTGRVLEGEASQKPANKCFTAYCHRCKKSTEYRYLSTLDYVA